MFEQIETIMEYYSNTKHLVSVCTVCRTKILREYLQTMLLSLVSTSSYTGNTRPSDWGKSVIWLK